MNYACATLLVFGRVRVCVCTFVCVLSFSGLKVFDWGFVSCDFALCMVSYRWGSIVVFYLHRRSEVYVFFYERFLRNKHRSAFLFRFPCSAVIWGIVGVVNEDNKVSRLSLHLNRVVSSPGVHSAATIELPRPSTRTTTAD